MKLGNCAFFVKDHIRMRGNIFDAPRTYGEEIAVLHMSDCLEIHFESPESLINFCQQHNIECKDQRNEKV